jgi:hypothetical protein
MNFFIFQGNPDLFDISGYIDASIESDLPVRWLVKRFKGEIEVGDRIFLWASAGSEKKNSGIVGYGKILSHPALLPDDELSSRFWKTDQGVGDQLRVDIEITSSNTSPKRLIKREWMKNDPILEDLNILKNAQGTNFQVNDIQGKRLIELVSNTGKPWSKSECVAALYLYTQLLDKPISKSNDSSVAELGVKIGRATTGVYNKIMNFRSIDPNDPRKGMSGSGKIDRQVWKNYYEASTGKLNMGLLREDYSQLFSAKTVVTQEKRSNDERIKIPQEASDDNVSDKRLVSISRRRGQPAFRKRLLVLYDGKCAITGEAVDEVVDAAHIVNHSQSGVNHSDNGILLRSDVHDLFDAGLLMVNPSDYSIIIDESLKETSYFQFNGNKLAARVDGTQPSKDYLARKNRSGA